MPITQRGIFSVGQRYELASDAGGSAAAVGREQTGHGSEEPRVHSAARPSPCITAAGVQPSRLEMRTKQPPVPPAGARHRPNL